MVPSIRHEDTESAPEPSPWRDRGDRTVYPLPFPEVTVDPGVFVPTEGSFLCWKYLFSERIGEGKTCLDVGCGCGILGIQLALNGARQVHAIDIDRNAIANTLANAFRNGVADRMTAVDVDLYEWEPDQRYDICVASLYQMPVDPFEEPTGHRPLDYWGRNLLDHFITNLPRLLADHGTAYVMQLSARNVASARKARLPGARGRLQLFSRLRRFRGQPGTDPARQAAVGCLRPAAGREERHAGLPARDHPIGRSSRLSPGRPAGSSSLTAEGGVAMIALLCSGTRTRGVDSV